MSDETEAIFAWLTKHGYPFELHVGHLLREAGWQIEHGATYNDPLTGKVREIDLHATYWVSTKPDLKSSVAIELVIECKSSVGKPWIVFSAPNETRKLSFFNLPTVDSFSNDARNTALTQKVHLPSFLAQPSRLGHGIVRAHSDNKGGDPTSPYSALQSALTAALAIGRHNGEMVLWLGGGWTRAHITLPTVVVDASLFEYTLGPDEQPRLTSVPNIGVVAVGPGGGQRVSVLVVSKEGLGEYVTRLTAEAKEFAQALLPHVPEVVARLKERVERVGRVSAL